MTLQDLAAQFRKNFGYLIQQIIAVGTAKLMDTDPVPTFFLVVGDHIHRDWLYFRTEVRIKEERK